MTPVPTPPAPLVRYGTPPGRWVLLATVLGSGMAGFDVAGGREYRGCVSAANARRTVLR